MDDRDQMREILKQAINRMKAPEADGRVSASVATSLPNGIRYAWPTSTGTKIIIQCTGPITKDGALVEVGSMSPTGDITWLLHPPIYIIANEHNPENLYPMDRPGDSDETIYKTYKKVFNLISVLVGDPVPE
jgi:hypothetical protein